MPTMGTVLCMFTKQEKLGGQEEGRLTVNKCNLSNLDDLTKCVVRNTYRYYGVMFAILTGLVHNGNDTR